MHEVSSGQVRLQNKASDLYVPVARINDIIHTKREISADTAVRLATSDDHSSPARRRLYLDFIYP